MREKTRVDAPKNKKNCARDAKKKCCRTRQRTMAKPDVVDEFRSSVVRDILKGTPKKIELQGTGHNKLTLQPHKVLQTFDTSLLNSSWGDNMKNFVSYGMIDKLETPTPELNQGHEDLKKDAGALSIAYLLLATTDDFDRYDEIAVLRALIFLMCHDIEVYTKVRDQHEKITKTSIGSLLGLRFEEVNKIPWYNNIVNERTRTDTAKYFDTLARKAEQKALNAESKAEERRVEAEQDEIASRYRRRVAERATRTADASDRPGMLARGWPKLPRRTRARAAGAGAPTAPEA